MQIDADVPGGPVGQPEGLGGSVTSEGTVDERERIATSQDGGGGCLTDPAPQVTCETSPSLSWVTERKWLRFFRAMSSAEIQD